MVETTDDLVYISDFIVSKTVGNGDNAGAIGGDIIEVTYLMEELLETQKRIEDKESDCQKIKRITNNILNTTDYLFYSTLG